MLLCFTHLAVGAWFVEEILYVNIVSYLESKLTREWEALIHFSKFFASAFSSKCFYDGTHSTINSWKHNRFDRRQVGAETQKNIPTLWMIKTSQLWLFCSLVPCSSIRDSAFFFGFLSGAQRDNERILVCYFDYRFVSFVVLCKANTVPREAEM